MKAIVECLLFRESGQKPPCHDLAGIGPGRPKPLLLIIGCIVPLEGQERIDSGRIRAVLSEVVNQDAKGIARGGGSQLFKGARQLNGLLEESENGSVAAARNKEAEGPITWRAFSLPVGRGRLVLCLEAGNPWFSLSRTCSRWSLLERKGDDSRDCSPNKERICNAGGFSLFSSSHLRHLKCSDEGETVDVNLACTTDMTTKSLRCHRVSLLTVT